MPKDKSYLQVVTIKTQVGQFALGIQELASGLYSCDIIEMEKGGGYSVIHTETSELYDIESAAAEGMRHVMGFVLQGGFDSEETARPTHQ